MADAQRAVLEGWVRRRTTARALAQRSSIVLECAEGHSVMEVSRRLGASADTVRAWRRRFVERGPDGLSDEPRPGVPRKITDADVERVVVKTLGEKPKNATHWSTRSTAAATGMSQSAISRIRRAFAPAPHRTRTFKLSTDPLFTDKVRDVVGLYLDPPEKALVLCVDEKSQIQAPERSRPGTPGAPPPRSPSPGLGDPPAGHPAGTTDTRSLALITGASAGIGYEPVRQFAEHGYGLVVDAEDERLESAARSLRETGARVRPVRPVRADPRIREGAQRLFAAVEGLTPDAHDMVLIAADEGHAGIGRLARRGIVDDFAAGLRVSATTTSSQPRELSRLAVNTLFVQLDGGTDIPGPQLPAPRLTRRATT
ncbi:IS630 family transposase [Streptomyces sp. NPDC013433]|uniref:IS630 family transposase n=1 Tax=Streptomyces sp. NPDC013433 TaxID=3155604 RepID=UPI0034552522